MLSIQEVGLSIMGDSPKKLYFLGGTEYGIKEKYIEILETKVGVRMEYTDMFEVVSMMSRRHIIPLEPHVYVVRYDKVFLSKLTKEFADIVMNLDVIGTIVGIYDEDKDTNKLDKFFPGNTASINQIDSKLMVKYLKQDFPKAKVSVLQCAAKNSQNYYQAKNVARCLLCIGPDIALSEDAICSMFGLSSASTTLMLQEAIASRNCAEFYTLVDHYDGDPMSVVYLIMRTMVELDKIQDSKYVKSPLKEFATKWDRCDIYNMFQHAYHILEGAREGTYVSMSDALICLGALMKFKNIPTLEVML